MSAKLKIVYRELTTLNILPSNFKRHALDEIEKSIRLRGFIDPVGYNPTTGNVFNGNGRTEVLQELFSRWASGSEDAFIPTGIEVKAKAWFVPTVDIEMTEDEEKSAAAAMNRLNELGGYDEAYMLEVLQELKGKDLLEGTGYDDRYIKDLLKRFPSPHESEPGAEDGTDSSGWDGVAAPLVGATSVVKQIALLVQPADYEKYQRFTLALAPVLNTTNATDTTMKALAYAYEHLVENADDTATDS